MKNSGVDIADLMAERTVVRAASAYELNLVGLSAAEVREVIGRYKADDHALCGAAFDLVNSIEGWLDDLVESVERVKLAAKSPMGASDAAARTSREDKAALLKVDS